MLEIITRFIQPIVPIRRGEWRKSILMFLYFALTLAVLYILKPVRSAFFLTAYGADNLRYAYVGEGVFLILVTFFYIKFSKLISKKNILLSAVTLFFAANIFLFWFLFKVGLVKWLAYLFYVWVAVYSSTSVTQCWMLANDIFNPQEAKRLFGFIISGGSFGGILGGLLTNRLAERIGTDNLLLLSGVLLCFCVVLINAIWKYERTRRPPEEEATKETPHSTARLRDKSTWKLFLNSKYLLLIAALVMIAKIASTVVDNQFGSVVENNISGLDEKTSYLGGFFGFLNGISFFMQFVIASYSLRILGIGISLLLLPIGLSVGAGFSIFLPALGVAAAVKAYDGSMNYSINQVSKEILYLPVPSRSRYRVKPLIDMLGYRVSKSVAGLLIILLTPLLGIPDEKLGILVLLLVPLWIMAAWLVRDEYMQSIKKLLSAKKEKVQETEASVRQTANVLNNLEGERSFDQLKVFLNARSSVTRKISAAALLAFHSGNRDFSRVKKLVEEMMRYEALELKGVDVNGLFQESGASKDGFLDRRLIDLLKAKQDPATDWPALLKKEEKPILLKLSESLNDPLEETANKKKAILILTTLGTQGAVDILLNGLSGTKDQSLRFNLIRGLNRIRAKGERREFNPWIIKKEVLLEVKNYKSILTALEAYQKQKASPRPQEDYLTATLEAMDQESLERIFRLLGLLYEREVIHIVYDRLVEDGSDKRVRANALELLENVLEPELSWHLLPVLDQERWAEAPKKKFEEIINEFLTSQDRWLSVCAVFLIAELRLANFYSKLKNTVYSQTPIVREAAEIALLKTGTGNN